MFQKFSSIYGGYEEYCNESKLESKKGKAFMLFKTIFTMQNILLGIVAFLLSKVTFGGTMIPLGMAFFAAVCSNNIPAVLVWTITSVSIGITFGREQVLAFILTSLIFVVLTVILKFDKFDKKNITAVKLFISVLVVQAVNLIFEPILIYDVITMILLSILTIIFYIIFTNAMPIISDFDKKRVYAKEEIIGVSIMLVIAISSLGELNVLGFSVRIVLSILVVLILGWKNGSLVGVASGTSIGVILAIMGLDDTNMIASYAFSGLIAGIFSKFGKVGVVVGFILGNAILTYTANGSVQVLISLKEILIASVGLLAIPKKIEIQIEDIIGKTRALSDGNVKTFEKPERTIQRLNVVSDAFDKMAESFSEVAITKEAIDVKKAEEFIEALRNKLNNDDVSKTEDIINYFENNLERVSDILSVLEENEKIQKQDLVSIIGDEDIIGITVLLNAINSIYEIYKVNKVWEAKFAENRKVVSKQLKGVSKVISSLADNLDEISENEIIELKNRITSELSLKGIILQDICVLQDKEKYVVEIYKIGCVQGEECRIIDIEYVLSKVLGQPMIKQRNMCANLNNVDVCVQKYITQRKYTVKIGVAKTAKKNSTASGDSQTFFELQDGKFLVALSDGMGSGSKAEYGSQFVIKMLEKFLTSGFDKKIAVELINSLMVLKSNEDFFSTMDLSVLNLYSGKLEFLKVGACPTYIKKENKVEIIKSESLPVGILNDADIDLYNTDLVSGDILVMITDGILESNSEVVNKEEALKEMLKNITTDNPQKIADLIIGESVDNDFGYAKDDMTVMVVKIVEK